MLRIGHLSTFYHTSILLMAQGGLDRILERPVQWELYGTGPSIIEAFNRDEIDMAYIGLPPVIIGIDRGVRVKCVAGGHMDGTVLSSHIDMKAYPEKNIEEVLAQLSGYEIGVPGKGSIHDVIMTELLERFNLLKRIRIINFKWADQVLEAFIKGNIIAAAGTPALAVAIIRYGKGKILYPPSMLWPNNPSYGIVVSQKLLDEDRDVLYKFLGIHEQATALLRDKPEEASEIISNLVGIVDSDFILETLRISPRYCAQLTEGYIKATMGFVKAMKRLGFINKDLEREDIFDTEMIRTIHGSENHY